MTKSELKKLIKETISEIGADRANPQSETADPRILAPSELSRWKAACEALSNKIGAALIGKPMTGELVKGNPYSYSSKRKPVQTVVKSVDVQLSYKTTPDATSGGSGFYVHIYARGEQGQAGQLIYGDYV